MSLIGQQRALLAAIVGDDAPSSGGIAVYQNAYRARLIEALKSGFERTWAWIGDDAFFTAAIHYVITHPPRSWTLDAFGADFPQVLSILFADDPEVAELAWLEWHMQQAFAAPDEAVVDAAGFAALAAAGLDWDAVRLVPVGSLSMRRVHTNATAIWHALADGTPPPGADQLSHAAALIVWRKALSPHFRLVARDEHRALSRLAAGARFGEICAAADGYTGAADEGARAARAGAWLGQWIADGLIASLSPVIAMR
jgi:hypothetical protein